MHAAVRRAAGPEVVPYLIALPFMSDMSDGSSRMNKLAKRLTAMMREHGQHLQTCVW